METGSEKSANKIASNKLYLLIRVILISVVMVAILMPLFHHFYIYPFFFKELLNITENEALRTGKHLTGYLLEEDLKNQTLVTDRMRQEILVAVNDFSLMKVKVFSASGEILFSTDEEDIGQINKHDYFHEIVAKGKTYKTTVQKDTKTLEGQSITADVVEAYVPIMSEGQFLGAFELYYDITERKNALDNLIFKITLLLIVLTFLLIAAITFMFFKTRKMIIERIELEEQLEFMASTDPLTQLLNRRMFMEYLNAEIIRFVRYSRPSALMIFDIDDFKKVNDTYGHQQGDEVLKMLADVCMDVLRTTDVIGRYGGEEFIVLLPETGLERSLMVADRIRATIENLRIPCEGQDISVTVSIGVTPFPEHTLINQDILIRNADQALYQAKESGKNQVVCHSEPEDLASEE